MNNPSRVSSTVLAALALFSFSVETQSSPLNSTSKHELGAGISVGSAFLVNARYGYNINKNVRLELEASRGSVEKLFFQSDDINYSVSGFLVGRYPYGANNSAVFVRGGAGLSEVSAPAFTSQTFLFGPIDTAYPELTVSGRVLQVGVGVEHFFSKCFGLRFDGYYTNDSAFDKISDTAGREPRDSHYAVVGASAVFRF